MFTLGMFSSQLWQQIRDGSEVLHALSLMECQLDSLHNLGDPCTVGWWSAQEVFQHLCCRDGCAWLEEALTKPHTEILECCGTRLPSIKRVLLERLQNIVRIDLAPEITKISSIIPNDHVIPRGSADEIMAMCVNEAGMAVLC
jgi:hypothetical protein